ncbi:GNAT family N-acetyltransferase [Geopsychrobacter electrodiphilus]|uniref:GNAT family N-acetyltransferase n=1 Tax=Geopsychrobacter electrodiphilus TaxID=225196 RepID=UPI0003691F32|nr:GNAT family N-acetyltransferase [Geopsychrobacter electrodiphilus]
MDIKIENNKSAKRFEAIAAGYRVFIDYELNNQTMTLIHTKVPSELEGQGLGGKIVKAALEYAKNHGLQVIPQCPFVLSYIERHQEYKTLIENEH